MSKVMGIFVKFWHFLRCPLTKYGHVTWPKKQISKHFYFFLILHLILGKVTKFIGEKLSTSKVISQKENTPSSAFRVTADVTLDDFQRYDLQRCSTENRSSVTSHCRDWLTYKILATLLRVFEHNSKTRNVLPLFRIRRKSFAMACYIAPIFVGTPRIVEKIIDCDISLTWGRCVVGVSVNGWRYRAEQSYQLPLQNKFFWV